MKRELVAISTVLLIAGVCCLMMTLNEHYLFHFHGANQDVAEFLTTMRRGPRPLTEIDFTALYGGSGQFQVLHPLLEMRKMRVRGHELAPSCNEIGIDISEWKSRDKVCASARLSHEDHAKREVFKQFLAEGGKLPDNFLTTPPFVDRSGISFAYWLAKSNFRFLAQKDWVEQHLSFFKASELNDVMNKYQINHPKYNVIARLTGSEMEEVIRGTPLVMTQDYLLIKNQARLAGC